MGGDEVEHTLDDLTGNWDLSTLPANVRIGRHCFIERRSLFGPLESTRDPGVVLGDRVRLYAGGWGGQITVKATGLLEIGDDAVLVGAQIMCADHIVIGRRVVISYNAVIADSDFHPRDPELRRHDAISGAPFGEFVGYSARLTAPVVIEDDARIGINAIILKGVHIGQGAEVYPGAVVTGDVPAGSRAVGNPATIVPASAS
jgi:acetyltransferase-like isoleucine patch superfamily enzyme